MKRPHSRTMTRRRFLARSSVVVAATGAWCLAGRLQRAEAASIGKVVVGAHPWVYAATQPDYDITPILDRIFADMRYAGMDGIELMHTALRPDDAVDRIAALSERHGLPVIGTSFSGTMWDRDRREEVLGDARRIIPRLAALGGVTLGTSVGSAGRKKTPQELDVQAEVLREILALASEHGVEVNLHNHKYEVENDLHDLRGTLERIPEARLGPDLDWLVQAGVDPVWFLREFGERIVFLHLRDQKKDKTWVEAMGEGDMDYAPVRRALEEIGFSGHAIIELAHPRGMKLTRPLRESLKMGRQFVKAKLGF